MFPLSRFQERINRTLTAIKNILETTKNPQLIKDVEHKYEDKYSVVEFMINTAIASILNVLDRTDGFNEDVMKNLIQQVNEKHRTVTLRFLLERNCKLEYEKTVEIESPTCKTERATVVGKKPKKKKVLQLKIVNKVKEYHWKVTVSHRIIVFLGTDLEQGVSLSSRSGVTTVVTRMNKSPLSSFAADPLDVNVTKLFQWIDPSRMMCRFVIDREQAITPRRNQQVEEVVHLLRKLSEWSNICRGELKWVLKSATTASLGEINANDVFVPILPIFLSGGGSDARIETNEANSKQKNNIENTANLVFLEAPPNTSPLVFFQDMSIIFLKEQCRSLDTAVKKLERSFPSGSANDDITTVDEAKMMLLWSHLTELANQCIDGVDYVENILYNQLIQAIGKEVNSTEFDIFLKFHNQRLFPKSYSPKPFCYAIRQPHQYPDGILSIVRGGSESKDSIETFARHIPKGGIRTSMSIPLSAATTAEFIGDQYLHGWMDTCFASQPASSNYLCARARQFSSFILVIGKISSPNEFTPEDAIILQNKDEILIPLILKDLPSAKEFKDATKSLSPEQARFAKSFRAMQLDSSVFGVCVIRVKPQLEAVLDLPPCSLTKEIKLTQDLLSLFVEYQITPALMSYDGPQTASAAEKISAVKSHVSSLLSMIQDMKDNQLNNEVHKSDMRAEINGPDLSGWDWARNRPLSTQFLGHGSYVPFDGPGGTGKAPGNTSVQPGWDWTQNRPMGDKSSWDCDDPDFDWTRAERRNSLPWERLSRCEPKSDGLEDECYEEGSYRSGEGSYRSGEGSYRSGDGSYRSGAFSSVDGDSRSYISLEKEYAFTAGPTSIPRDGVPGNTAGQPEWDWSRNEPMGNRCEWDWDAPDSDGVYAPGEVKSRCQDHNNVDDPEWDWSRTEGPNSVPRDGFPGNKLVQPDWDWARNKPLEGPMDMDKTDSFDKASKLGSTSIEQESKSEIRSGKEIEYKNMKFMPHMEPITDFTAIPKQLDQTFERLGTENALRTVVLQTGDQWQHKQQFNLLSPMQDSIIEIDKQRNETKKALDLLDALSRSGSLPIHCGELHVIIGVRHLFEQNAMDTIIRKNVNPIEKVDSSSLLIASKIHCAEIKVFSKDSAKKV